jgi:hypothetical protein
MRGQPDHLEERDTTDAETPEALDQVGERPLRSQATRQFVHYGGHVIPIHGETRPGSGGRCRPVHGRFRGRRRGASALYSNGASKARVSEVADYPVGGVAVRDSKDPNGPKLIFTLRYWRAFTNQVKAGTHDLA